eukprot:g7260.t1
MVWYWNDPRLIGKADRVMPDDLWRPSLRFNNSSNPLFAVDQSMTAGRDIVMTEAAWESGNISITFGIVIRREFWYYFYKVILLMWLITVLSAATFLFSPAHFEQRINIAATMFLATAASLYVAGADLPKASALTRLDIVVLSTLFMLFAAAAETCVLFFMLERDLLAIERAEEIDEMVAAGFCTIYAIVNVWMFLIPYHRMSKGPQRNALQKERTFVPWEDAPINDPWGAGEGSTILGKHDNKEGDGGASWAGLVGGQSNRDDGQHGTAPGGGNEDNEGNEGARQRLAKLSLISKKLRQSREVVSHAI